MSIYIELDGLDDCTEDMFQATSNEKEVSLTITKAGSQAPQQRFLSSERGVFIVSKGFLR